MARKEDLDSAVLLARAAFKSWSSKTPFSECSGLMLAYADAIEANRVEIEKLQTMEQGKPLGLAHVEADMTLHWLRTFATMEVKAEVIEDTDERAI
jgi:acyl-CoA reductase-like NAD-dependent aldehyde dehydrogenase